jgi:peptidoglycan/xylan/chitin deacetylase (PgdA/CDA1 family)
MTEEIVVDSLIYILTFHGLGHPERDLPIGEIDYWLDADFFEAILERVSGRSDVCITFDDCNSSDFKIAFPALLKRQLRATFFVVAERIDRPGFLTGEQIRALASAGMTIGSHGTRHQRWTQLNGSDLYEELHVSRRAIERVIGDVVREVACPFGSYNRKVLRGLREAGYEKIYTSDQGVAERGEWISARNTILRSHNLGSIENIIFNNGSRGMSSILRASKLALKRWL